MIYKTGNTIFAFTMILLIILTTGCLSGSRDDPGEITVSAAISLLDAFREMGLSFQEQNPGVTVYFNFASSGTLMRQIEQGASVDIFASASRKEMDDLEEKGLILNETRMNFARNRLAIVAPVATTIEDLKNKDIKKIALGNPETVPAGYYARTALENAGSYQELGSKYIFSENVRQALEYVELGEVDAGFVYLSDTLKNDLAVSRINESLYPAIVYPAAVVHDSRNKELAKKFMEFMLSEEGQTILHRHGFE